MLNKRFVNIYSILICLIVLYPHEQLSADGGFLSNSEIIMTGAGVRLRQRPQRSAKKVTLLRIGTIVSLLDRTINAAGEEWYKIATPDGKKGWVISRYTLSLDNFNNREQAYIEVANRKINSNNFGDLVELCNFLNRASVQVTLPAFVAELKLLYLLALQRSLEVVPRSRQHEPRYSKWRKQQRAEIEYNRSTGTWLVKQELFQQLYDKYSHLPIADRIWRESVSSGFQISRSSIKNKTVPGNKIFITHLSFMNTRAGMPLESNIANLINQAVREGVQFAQQSMPHLKWNEAGHQIDNSDENVNQFINLFFDFNLTKSEKIAAIIQQMMIPNRVEVILTGQYVEKTGGIIHVRPLILSKSKRRIVTRNLIFQKKEFVCSYTALCQKALMKIRDAVQELLGNI